MSDPLGDRERDRAADQGDTECAFALTGADVGPDQRHQRRAEPEHDRHQQIFEPRTCPISRDRFAPPTLATNAVANAMITLVRTELIELQKPTARMVRNKGQRGREKCNPATLRPDRMYQAEYRGRPRVEQHDGRATARNSESRKRPDAEDQTGRQRYQQNHTGAGHHMPAPACCRCRGSRWRVPFMVHRSTLPPNTMFE